MAANEGSVSVIRAGALILALTRRTGESCATCHKTLCGHDLLIAFMLGEVDSPRCPACSASELSRETGAFIHEARVHARGRDCFAVAWDWADARELSCPFSAASVRKGGAFEGAEPETAAVAVLPDAEWDAGDMGCGVLVLELGRRLRSMPAGWVLLVTADDPGAAEELPAWCRTTGYGLVYAGPPVYAVRNKEG